MFNSKKGKITFGIIMTVLNLVVADIARADGQDGYGNIFNHFFGEAKTRENQSNCEELDGPKQGIIGIVNSFFCHMEKDMGITGPTDGVTKPFGKMIVRAAIKENIGGIVANGDTYDYEGLVWTCNLSEKVTCTNPVEFGRAFYIAWSFNEDQTINRGHVIVDPGTFEDQGSGKSAIKITYDLGLASPARKISARVLLPYHTGPGGTLGFNMRAEAKLVNNLITVAVVESESATANRFAGQIDEITGIGAAYFESDNATGPGTGKLQRTLKNDDQSSKSVCVKRESYGTDYIYNQTGELGCQVPAFPDESVDDVAAYTAALLLGDWNKMLANPSQL